ncbi:MAG TPA: cytochrome c oxidase assembly protein [Microbacterium sp.]|nr:cytochrome c oxidase assembly protein [Microbacterium sp.]
MTPAHVHAHPSGGADGILWIVAVPFAVAIISYLAGMVIQGRRGRPWSPLRGWCWMLGCGVALIGMLGPLVSPSFDGFVGHMTAHLLVGMLAPLLLVLAAPMTLALRTLDRDPARRLSRLLRSAPARLVTAPAVAAALNIGSMWALYFTPLWELAEVPFFHLVLMLHFLIVGYLFTVSIVGVDPNPHRASFTVRAIVLMLALAAHSVLAKLIYAEPPPGVSRGDGEVGAQVMFYGGDLIDVALMVVLCAEWYRVSGRRLTSSTPKGRREARGSGDRVGTLG